MATLEAQRRARAAHVERQRAAGVVKVTVPLSAEARARLARLARVHGSNTAAVEAGLAALEAAPSD